MKLKNSYILLIVMAIFLLVSMGSVCANEDVSDAALADDGSDAVLANSTGDTPIDTVIIVPDDIQPINEKSNPTISLTVKDNESNNINVTKNDLTVKENTKNITFDYNNDSIIISKLTKGNHTLTITYLGNAIYKNSTKNILLSIYGNYTLESASSINVNQTNKIELPLNVTNGVNVKPDVTIDNFKVEISYKDGNDTKKISNITGITYENGKLVFTNELVENITSYTMTVTYNDTNCSAQKKVTLKKVRCINITPENSEVNYQDGEFTFKVIDAITGEPIANTKIYVTGKFNGTTLYWDIKQSGGSISLSTSKAVTTDENGTATIKNANFYPGLILSDSDIYSPAGDYNLTLTCSDDLSGKLDTTVTIKNIATKMTIDNLNEYYGTSKKITIKVVNAETGKPLTSVPVHFKVTSSSGSEIKYSNNNNTITVLYTNANGTVQLPVNSLIAGKYTVSASLNGTKNYGASNATKTITIKTIPIKYTVTMKKTMYYDTDKIVTIKVINKLTNKPVAGAIVIIQFDKSKNQVYGFQSDKKGIVTVRVPLGVGTHSMYIQDGGEGRFKSTPVTKSITVKKSSAKISAPKITAYYKQGKYFTIKLTNTKNKKPIYYAKLNIRVYVSSTRYYEYKKVMTGLTGVTKLAVDLKPGTYKVEVRGAESKNFAAKKVTSKIVIKKAPTKLTPKKLTAKKGASKYFKVTVKNTKTKKIIAGVKVKIKVYTGKKYKTYTVKTNKKGIAQINVKSLKVGTHKVVVTSANKYCVAKAAKSTIKITKK